MAWLIALTAVVSAQDADSRYRDGLYQEVDKGDLAKAEELYRALEADTSAPEALRAKAAFRRAWCLEKRGAKTEAEKAYREVASRYSGQAESAQRARERLDRLVSGDGTPQSVVSIDAKIRELILELASPSIDISRGAVRTLTLIGEPAVPALRQTLQHKDPQLAAMAAYPLIRLERDEGVFPVLMAWIRRGEIDHPQDFAAVLKRRPEHMKVFLDEFRKTDDSAALSGALSVIRHLEPTPDLRDLLRDKIASCPFPNLVRLTQQLDISTEDELFTLMELVRKAPEAPVRTLKVLGSISLPVKDVRRFSQFLLDIFPKGVEGELEFLQNLAPMDELLRQVAGPWLKEGTDAARMTLIERGIHPLKRGKPALILNLLDGELPEWVRSMLVNEILSFPDELAPAEKAASEGNLWKAFDGKDLTLKTDASEWLLQRVPETHPRWEELIRFEIDQPPLPQTVMSQLYTQFTRPEAKSWNPSHSNIPIYFKKWTPEGQARARRVACKRLLEGNVEDRRRALPVLGLFPSQDRERNDALVALAGDASVDRKLRIEAIDALHSPHAEVPGLTESLQALLKDEDAGIRYAAVVEVCRTRSAGTDAILAGMVSDPSPLVVTAVVKHYADDPRDGLLEPLVRGLGSSHAGVRNLAVTGLGRTERLDVVPALLKHLEDPDPDVRARVRAALAQIRKRYEEKTEWQEWYDRVKSNEKK